MEELKKLDLNQSPEATKETVAKVVETPVTKALPRWPLMILAMILGAASGFGLYKLLPVNPQTTGVDVATGQVKGSIKVGDVVGNPDEQTFRDKAEGVIEKGTQSGEGSHSLLREGGPSKTANLTSSVIDLDQFVGMRVEIWGETFAAQKSGWLMDAGRIKVLELNAPKPADPAGKPE